MVELDLHLIGLIDDQQITAPVDQLGEAQLFLIQLWRNAGVDEARRRRDPDISVYQVTLGLVKRTDTVEWTGERATVFRVVLNLRWCVEPQARLSAYLEWRGGVAQPIKRTAAAEPAKSAVVLRQRLGGPNPCQRAVQPVDVPLTIGGAQNR